MTRNERTNALGLFNFARSYRAAADKLRRTKLRATHRDSPVTFLYYHAIELYLKAFLRDHGTGVKRLRSIGHKYGVLRKRAAKKGLHFDDGDEEVIAMLAATSEQLWSRSRYLETGFMRRPSLPALARTCRNLDRRVARALISAGVVIYPPPKARRVGD